MFWHEKGLFCQTKPWSTLFLRTSCLFYLHLVCQTPQPLFYLLTLCKPTSVSSLSVACTWGSWGPWGTCSKRCGGGTQTSTRAIAKQAKNGGSPCLGESEREQRCNEQICASIEGESIQKMVCTWLREISSCSCLTVLPGPAWVLLSKTQVVRIHTGTAIGAEIPPIWGP